MRLTTVAAIVLLVLSLVVVVRLVSFPQDYIAYRTEAVHTQTPPPGPPTPDFPPTPDVPEPAIPQPPSNNSTKEPFKVIIPLFILGTSAAVFGEVVTSNKFQGQNK